MNGKPRSPLLKGQYNHSVMQHHASTTGISLTCNSSGPSIKYVTLFLANFDPLQLSHFVTHPGTPHQKRTSHISDPHFQQAQYKKPGQKPLYKFSLNCSRGFCSGVLSGDLLSGRFCPGWFFYPFPLLSENICYDRKLNITLNFMFHMCDKKCISVTSHALYPPPVTNGHTFSAPRERDVLYGRPLISLENFFYSTELYEYASALMSTAGLVLVCSDAQNVQ